MSGVRVPTGEAEILKRKPGIHTGPVLDEKDGFQVIECRACRYKHLNPIPSQEFLDDFYNRNYYQNHKSDYLANESREDAYWRIAFAERLGFFARHAPGKTLLDVGCGGGAFLRFARERGWKVVGVEPSEAASGVARSTGLEVHAVPLEAFQEHEERRFHVIHLKNVLEHVPEPGRVLDICRRLMAPGGILYVEVPNDYELMQKVGVKMVKQRRSWVSIPDHVNYFSFASGTGLLKRRGFRVLARDTTFPMYLFLWFGLDFIGSRDAGARAHAMRIRLETFLHRNRLGFVKRAAFKLLAHLSMGRTVILYGRKEKENA